jgi:DNA-directed RNA polymerase subunit H (RpoH/RPB5)
MLQGRNNFASNKWKHDVMDELLQLKISTVSMLMSRGYIVPDGEKQFKWTDYADYQIVKAAFVETYESLRKPKESFRQAMTKVYSHITSNGKRILVRFISPLAGAVHISKDQVNGLIATIMQEGPFDEVLVISSHPLAPGSSNSLKTDGYRNIKVYLDQDVFVDPEEFFLNSIHRAMTLEETRAFYSKNGLSPSNMPQLTEDDPVVVKNGWPPGTLVEITRDNTFTNGIATLSIYYRIVSHNRANLRKGR